MNIFTDADLSQSDLLAVETVGSIDTAVYPAPARRPLNSCSDTQTLFPALAGLAKWGNPNAYGSFE